MKKGRREGNTELAHKLRPVFAATKLVFENTSKNIIKLQIIQGQNKDFSLIIIHLNIKILTLSIKNMQNILLTGFALFH